MCIKSFASTQRKGDSMATANQIKYRMGQAKKKLAKLNKDVTATKAKVKKLESALKKAKATGKAKPKKKKAAAKKKTAPKKKTKRTARKKK
jgi:hypothetical protein